MAASPARIGVVNQTKCWPCQNRSAGQEGQRGADHGPAVGHEGGQAEGGQAGGRQGSQPRSARPLAGARPGRHTTTTTPVLRVSPARQAHEAGRDPGAAPQGVEAAGRRGEEQPFGVGEREDKPVSGQKT